MKTLTIIAALVTLSACAYPNPSNPDFDGYHYVGDKTPEAVCEYVEDSADAVEEVLGMGIGIDEVLYDPKSGRIVVKSAPNEYLDNFEARDVMKAFADRRLKTTGLVDIRVNSLDRYFDNTYHYGGISRAQALYNIPTTCPDSKGINFPLDRSNK